MTREARRPGLATLALAIVAVALGAYFTFAAVQGEYGVFRQVQIEADRKAVTAERDRLAARLAVLQNLNRRLSDEFLDLDLLDERARDVLGYLRTDEIVIR